MSGKLHVDEVNVDASLAGRLVGTQFNAWAGLPVVPLDSAGSGNVIFRLGDEMILRFPRIARAATHVDKELEWLPRLASALPLAIPTPLGRGVPGEGYPWPWCVYRWLDGEHPSGDNVDMQRAADAIGGFVAELQAFQNTGGPEARRGRPLAVRDAETRAAISSLRGTLDVDAVTSVWNQALAVPVWQGPPKWIHGDLHAANLLVQAGRLNAVIDFGSSGVGDPAIDMMVAWTLLTAETRRLFRARVLVDDATWARGRGWALTFGVVALPYYRVTNPLLAKIARRAIDQVLADDGGSV